MIPGEAAALKLFKYAFEYSMTPQEQNVWEERFLNFCDERYTQDGNSYLIVKKDVGKVLDFIRTELEKAKREAYEELELKLAKLDWIKILDESIKSRPNSWYNPAVREWRNASDEIYVSVLRAIKQL